MLWLAIGFNVAVILTTPYFPFGDTANHLARYTLISRIWAGTAPSWVSFHLLPTGYVAVDIFGAALVSLFGPRVTMHLLGALYAVMLPFSMYCLLRAVNARSTGLALVGCLLTFNWYFITGFLSYSLGIPLTFFWLTWWWPRRHAMGANSLACGAIGISLLYMVHMSAAAVALIAVSVCSFETSMIASFSRAAWRLAVRKAAEVMALALPSIALYLLMKFSFPPAEQNQIIFRTPIEKLKHVIAPFATFSAMQAAILLLSYITALGVYLWYVRSAGSLWSKWLVVPLALMLAYIVSPVFALDAWDVDVRFLVPAFLLVFVNPNQTQTFSRRATAFLAALSIVHGAVTWKYAESASSRTAEVVSLLHSIPDGPNVLYLAPEYDAFYRSGPLVHTGEWLTIDRPGWRVNGLFVGGPNGAYLDHFTELNELYDPGTTASGIPPLQWDRVRHDYKFIVLVGGNRDGTYSQLRKGSILVRRTPLAALFRVTGASAQTTTF
jgi:hypothetical protein